MTVQGKKDGGKPKQYSEVQLREFIRPHVPDLIRKLLELVDNADQDSAKIGAAKILLSKVMPDLKSTEVKGEGAKALAGILTIIAQRNQAEPVAKSDTV
jgi:hypothetical protein